MPKLHLLIVLVDCLLNIVKKIHKFRETSNLKHIYKNKLDKAWFSHGVAYSDSKDVIKRTISDTFWEIKLIKLL